MKNKNLNLTRKNVKAVFGEPNQEKNGEMIYGCQLCKEEGHDTDNDHLKINVEKGCITCFANEEHSKFYRKMYSEYVAKTKKRRSTENLEKDSEAISIGRLAMKNNEQAREILKSYGYNDSTIDRMPICLFDGWFGISMYNTKNEFLGFEFRDDEKYKFSHKTKGYADDIKNTLCVVYPAKEKKNIFVMAGFKDAHIMYQYLNENGRLDDNYIDLLFEISNIDIEKADDNIKKFKENQIEFLKSYAKMIETKDHFITFMEILTQLFKQEKLIAGQEYKFIKGGIAVYLKSIMPAFREMLKRTSEFDEYIPDEKEIKHASQKYGCTPDYNVNFNNKTRRTLLIPPHVEGMDYIMSILLQQNDDDNNAGTVI